MPKMNLLSTYSFLLIFLIATIILSKVHDFALQSEISVANQKVYNTYELKYLFQKFNASEHDIFSLENKETFVLKTKQLYKIEESRKLELYNYFIANNLDTNQITNFNEILSKRSILIDNSVELLNNIDTLKLVEYKTQCEIINSQITDICDAIIDEQQKYVRRLEFFNVIFSILYFIITVAIFIFFLYVIIKRYFLPLVKMSKSINKIIKNDFNFNEHFVEVKYQNKVGMLSQDIRKMLDKIATKNNELNLQQQKTSEALQNFKLLSDIGKNIITQLDVKNIVKVIYDNINPLIPITTFGIGIYNQSDNILKMWKLDSFSKKIQYNYEKIEDSKDIAVISFLRSKEILIKDYLKEYHYYINELGHSLSMNKSMIFAPLKTTDATIGVIYTKYKNANIYQEFHLDILRNLAIYIAIAIENANAFEMINLHQREILERNEELNQQREEILNINESLEIQKQKLEEAFTDIKFLSKIGQEITSNLSFESITENIYKNINKFMDVTVFGIGVYNKKLNRIEFAKLIENNIYLPFNCDNLSEETLSVYCLKNGKEVIINDIQTEYSKYLTYKPEHKFGTIPTSIVYLPLSNKGEKLGVITVQSHRKFAYTEQDINIIRTLGGYISIALLNAMAFEEIEVQKNTIKESEQKMSDIINFIPDPLMVIDTNGKLMSWNKSMEELTGVKAEKAVGTDSLDYSLYFYEQRRPMLCDLILAPTTEWESKYSNLTRLEDKLIGQSFVPKLNKYLWGAARLLYNSNKQIVGAIQISKDITEHINTLKKIEETNVLLNEQKLEIENQNSEIMKKSIELHELVEELKTTSAVVDDYNKQLEKLSIVASKTENAVMIANFDGKIEWVNEGFERLYGQTLSSFKNLKGETIYEVTTHPDLQTIVEESVKTKKSSVYITKNLNAMQEEMWVQTTLTPIFANDVLDKIVTIDTDISKIKLAEKEIENQNKKITYSIQYARRIQSAILTPKRLIDRTLAEYFILYKPRDIVSGDFYWVSRKQTKILIAVADCTGHGVPGAFMSILGISFLNEIVTKIVEKNAIQEIQASTILNQLKVNVIKSLHQKGKQLETKDGMDIAICIFDIDSRTIQYAGANLPLILIREQIENEILEVNPNKVTMQSYDDKKINVYEIKPDKYPIGISKGSVDNFEDKEFKIKNGDTIYMNTDGYIDQFGGEAGRKYLSKNFKILLTNVVHEKMEEQEKILDQTIEQWKAYPRETGKEWNQIDDILVMGIKF